MTTYTDLFGSTTVPPAEQGYSSLSMTATATLQWAEFYDGSGPIATAIIDVTADNTGYNLKMPGATRVSTGRDILVRNVGSNSITLTDSAAGSISTIASGAALYAYLKTNATEAGTWGAITYGVGTSSVDAATLVGYGIKAITTSLNQTHPITSGSGNWTIGTTHRAQFVVGTATGTSTVALTAAATLGNDFFFFYRNSGAGTATINPDGAETIDGQSTLEVQPGESLICATNGANWFSVGYGRSMLYQFTQLVYDISGGGPFTLSSSEAANKLITFTGNPAADVTVTVPQVVAVYYVYNNISTNKTVTFKTAAGVGIAITQTTRAIAICDGTEIVSATTVAASTSISLVNGSAASPALNFASHTNTGMYLDGTQGIGFSIDGTGRFVVDDDGMPTFATDTAVVVAVGTTAQRPAAPAVGMVRYNSTTGKYECYKNSAWQTLSGGATGGGSDEVFQENALTVTTNYTLSTNKSASSVGPITVNSGVTVTVPTGFSWVVLG